MSVPNEPTLSTWEEIRAIRLPHAIGKRSAADLSAQSPDPNLWSKPMVRYCKISARDAASDRTPWLPAHDSSVVALNRV